MSDMLVAHFRMLARYNTIVNQRLYEACGKLTEDEYKKNREGSFGSIHGTLNHILLGDRRWMALFTDQPGAEKTPALNTELYNSFGALQSARQAEDARIEEFLNRIDASFFDKQFRYINVLGNLHIDPAPLALAHLFNHQTHHRSQVQTMLRQTAVKPPSLDLHRAIRPNPQA